MTLKNKKLRRTPLALIRGNPDEAALLEELVDAHGGGEPAVVYRDVLIAAARALLHERNSLAPERLDTNAFPARRMSDLDSRTVRFA
jgi:hypothetical protein